MRPFIYFPIRVVDEGTTNCAVLHSTITAIASTFIERCLVSFPRTCAFFMVNAIRSGACSASDWYEFVQVSLQCGAQVVLVASTGMMVADRCCNLWSDSHRSRLARPHERRTTAARFVPLRYEPVDSCEKIHWLLTKHERQRRVRCLQWW